MAETEAFAYALALRSGASWLAGELAGIGIISLPAAVPAGIIAAASALGSAALFALVRSGGHLEIGCLLIGDYLVYPSWGTYSTQSSVALQGHPPIRDDLDNFFNAMGTDRTNTATTQPKPSRIFANEDVGIMTKGRASLSVFAVE